MPGDAATPKRVAAFTRYILQPGFWAPRACCVVPQSKLPVTTSGHHPVTAEKVSEGGCRRRFEQTGKGRHRRTLLPANTSAETPSCRPKRYACAARLSEAGYDTPTIPELLGHKEVKTAMIHSHALSQGPRGCLEPSRSAARDNPWKH